MWNVGCGMWNVGCGMLDVECWMWNGEWGMWHGNVLPQITQIFTETMRADILKNTNLSNLSNDD